jgi:hypothetical protein
MFPKEYIGLASGNINLYKFKLSTIKTDLVKILT